MRALRRISVAVLYLAVVMSGGAMAQTFPAKPVRIIVGTAAGGSVDAISRITDAKLAERWPHAVVVENRAGAGGAVGSEFAAKSAPDGHTLLTILIAHAVIPASHRNLGYDPVRDLTPEIKGADVEFPAADQEIFVITVLPQLPKR